MKPYFVIITLSVFWSLHGQAGIIHVPQDYASIQVGINSALNGDTVLVADNTYYENINFRGKAITVGSHFITDGDTNHIANTVINGFPIDPDSGSVVYFISGEDTNSILSGFTIAYGTGTPITPSFLSTARAGGGILCLNSGARITHNLIINNSVADPARAEAHGGGICSKGDSNNFIIIEDNIIKQNTVDADTLALGAGIRIGTNARIINNTILENVTTSRDESYGGGIAVVHTSPPWGSIIVTGNTIAYNQAVSSQGFGGQGGGLTIFWYNEVTVKDNTITHNMSGGPVNCWGAGMVLGYVQAGNVEDNIISNNSASSGNLSGTVNLGYCNDLIIQRNLLEHNSAYWGGGIRIDYGQGNVIADNRLVENDASFGGGIWIWDSSPIIENNLIIGNQADFGGGIRIFTPTAGANQESGEAGSLPDAAYGSALKGLAGETSQIHSNSRFVSQPQIINNTFSRNIATASGGGIQTFNSQAVVMNSILWGNSAASGPEIYVGSGGIDVNYSDIQGGFLGTGNIDVDPVFADTVDYYLSDPSSPAIDAGNPDPFYNDPEDPNNPGFACWPALGTVTNDIGAYGGSGVICDSIAVGIHAAAGGASLLERFTLLQNYPNPFNPSTTIEFSLPQSGFVTLKIYNILGEEVATLISQKLAAGKYKYDWPARSSGGDVGNLASGVYLYRIRAGNHTQIKKMILMK